MPNELSLTGSTRITWSLTDSQDVGAVARTVDVRNPRSITHGTGPNQGTACYTARHFVTGSTTLALPFSTLVVNSFGSTGTLNMTTVKEVCAIVSATGSTGAYVFVGGGTGVTGITVNRGGEYHWADWLVGLAPTAWVGSTFRIQNPTTTGVNVDVTIAGIGTYT